MAEAEKKEAEVAPVETPKVEAESTTAPANAEKAPRRSRAEGDGEHRPRKPMARRKVCQFCLDKVEHIDYKDVAKIRRYIAENGKIISRRQTGTCAKHQREIATAIKRARHMGMIYYKGE